MSTTPDTYYEYWRGVAAQEKARADRAEAALARVKEWAETDAPDDIHRADDCRGYRWAQADVLHNVKN